MDQTAGRVSSFAGIGAASRHLGEMVCDGMGQVEQPRYSNSQLGDRRAGPGCACSEDEDNVFGSTADCVGVHTRGPPTADSDVGERRDEER